ncbi:sensor domain-containing diguanylate cyclase [Afipia broomeae]|uniref:Diguanylate cyclase (GGDEF) domain-containing protein n=1 Tax=Afipia broomeae ATCC 49717 TaxID=883078 RepID=K8NVT8_9BRAD|nr:sensor domain-containing diguanylate cyclase [Afipia broomeae]EKS34447.1 diguanylate cyclase (GGDEF) domain-containing protein [Afipia broomeae ATCC 49717]
MSSDTNEDLRLQALRRYDILDTAPEETFDRITRIVAAALRVPMAAVSLVDDHRQWFKSRIGLAATETPRSSSFCAHTILANGAMVVTDTTQDLRFNGNPLVLGDPHIRFYAGYPVVSSDGVPLGAVCAIDTSPRDISPQELGLLKDLAALVNEQLELRLLASIDGLTGALRRKTFLNMCERELLLGRRGKTPSSCLMIDADHFKAINDQYGHDVGDQVLKALVDTFKAGLRATDIVGRLGGEEFGIFLPSTDLAGCVEVAERLRGMVESLEITTANLSVTVSIGAAEAAATGEDILGLLHRADTALLKAKRTGRNRIITECDSETLCCGSSAGFFTPSRSLVG